VQALLGAEAQDTVYTDAFSVGWDAPHRVLRSCIAAAEAHQDAVVGEYHDPKTGNRWPVQRFQPFDIHAGVTGTIEAMLHWAGESVAGVKKVQPASEIVRELAGEAAQLLRRWS
jgi:hypothetical protein